MFTYEYSTIREYESYPSMYTGIRTHVNISIRYSSIRDNSKVTNNIKADYP